MHFNYDAVSKGDRVHKNYTVSTSSDQTLADDLSQLCRVHDNLLNQELQQHPDAVVTSVYRVQDQYSDHNLKKG